MNSQKRSELVQKISKLCEEYGTSNIIFMADFRDETKNVPACITLEGKQKELIELFISACEQAECVEELAHARAAYQVMKKLDEVKLKLEIAQKKATGKVYES